MDWLEPATTNPSDRKAAKVAQEFWVGWFANPIYVNGDYPQVMKDMVARKSRNQGYNESRLPAFTHEEKRWINGTF